jgi:hypothetical protein
MMSEQRTNLIKYAVVAGTVLNLGMCLNLYLQLGRMQYQVSQLDSNVASAIQTLSRYIWEMKNNSETYSGEFQ